MAFFFIAFFVVVFFFAAAVGFTVYPVFFICRAVVVMKPHFFLGELVEQREFNGFTLYISGTEYARDLTAPPAMSLGATIFIRQESLRRMIWEKVEEWRWNRPENAMRRAIEHIRAGDAFQIVLSQRLSIPFQAQPLDLYRALRGLNPSPYMYYLDLEDFHIVGSSPEILARLERGQLDAVVADEAFLRFALLQSGQPVGMATSSSSSRMSTPARARMRAFSISIDVS